MGSNTRKCKLSNTDYSLCSLCQRSRSETLHNVTEKGLPSLQYAVGNRKGDIATRLKNEVNSDDFIQKNPKYHGKCKKNLYANNKTFNQKSQTRDESPTNEHISMLSLVMVLLESI